MFSPGVERALQAAYRAHEGQARKGMDAGPYVLHPVHVALLLARIDADEEILQAAILHDVVEDAEEWTLERVSREFSERVMHIVSDLTEDKSKSWEERKRWAVEHVPVMSPEARLVKAADKLHNLSCLLADLESAQESAGVWRRFRGGRERTLEMSGALVEVLAPMVDPRLGRALLGVMRELRRH